MVRPIFVLLTKTQKLPTKWKLFAYFPFISAFYRIHLHKMPNKSVPLQTFYSNYNNMEVKIIEKIEDLPLEDLKECIASGGTMDFVARKNPKGIIVKKLKNGKTKISVEMTQEKLNEAIANMARLEKERLKNQDEEQGNLN